MARARRTRRRDRIPVSGSALLPGVAIVGVNRIVPRLEHPATLFVE
jgi:hypothetical protein